MLRREQRDAADGGFCIFLYLRLGFGGAVPMGHQEAAFFYLFLELVPGVDEERVVLAEFARLVVDRFLYLVQQNLDPDDKLIRRFETDRARFFRQSVPAGDFHSAALKIAHPDTKPDRHAAKFVLRELPSGTLIVAVVVLHRNAGGAKF